MQEVEIGNKTDSQLAIMTMRIMQSLQNNLDGKSKQYKDPALTYLFLMNNIHYMVRSLSRYGDKKFKLQTFTKYERVDRIMFFCCCKVRSKGFTGWWLGSNTPKDRAAKCKPIQKSCLGKGLSVKGLVLLNWYYLYTVLRLLLSRWITW